MKVSLLITETVRPLHGSSPWTRPLVLIRNGTQFTNAISYRGRDNKAYVAVFTVTINETFSGTITYRDLVVNLAEQPSNHEGDHCSCQWDNLFLPGFGICSIKVLCET